MPRQLAQTFPPALKVPSTVARSSVRLTTFAERKTESLVGAGRRNLMLYSEVTVQGGRSAFARFIKAKAAVQLQWQSSNVQITPPFNAPEKASYFFSGFHSATTSLFFGKLRMCRPSGFVGPHPQHELRAAYCSWSERFFMLSTNHSGKATHYERLRRFPFSIARGAHDPPHCVTLRSVDRVPGYGRIFGPT
jgi:hypothetical protein